MTQNITKAINEEEKIIMETAALFISICYTPWFLKSYMITKAPSNDLSAVKSSFHIRDHYPRLRQALLAGMQHHFWNLPDDLVLLALADDDTELELKSKTS
jgi:uroporphyrinogen-III decarboxylase